MLVGGGAPTQRPGPRGLVLVRTQGRPHLYRTRYPAPNIPAPPVCPRTRTRRRYISPIASISTDSPAWGSPYGPAHLSIALSHGERPASPCIAHTRVCVSLISSFCLLLRFSHYRFFLFMFLFFYLSILFSFFFYFHFFSFSVFVLFFFCFTSFILCFYFRFLFIFLEKVYSLNLFFFFAFRFLCFLFFLL